MWPALILKSTILKCSVRRIALQILAASSRRIRVVSISRGSKHCKQVWAKLALYTRMKVPRSYDKSLAALHLVIYWCQPTSSPSVDHSKRDQCSLYSVCPIMQQTLNCTSVTDVFQQGHVQCATYINFRFHVLLCCGNHIRSLKIMHTFSYVVEDMANLQALQIV